MVVLSSPVLCCYCHPPFHHFHLHPHTAPRRLLRSVNTPRHSCLASFLRRYKATPLQVRSQPQPQLPSQHQKSVATLKKPTLVLRCLPNRLSLYSLSTLQPCLFCFPGQPRIKHLGLRAGQSIPAFAPLPSPIRQSRSSFIIPPAIL